MENKFFTAEYFNDNTGRFTVTSLKTGKKYVVEPIHENTAKGWGDVNPATNSVEGAYGGKYKGSVKKEDTILKEENDFVNITHLGIGVSPLSYIEELEKNSY